MIPKFEEDMSMIRMIRIDPALRSKRLLWWDRFTNHLPPASNKRVHSLHWTSQGDCMDHGLGGGTCRGLWIHSGHQEVKLYRRKRLWFCRWTSSLKMGVHDLTFTLDTEDAFEGEGMCWWKHGSSFVGMGLLFWTWGFFWILIGVLVGGGCFFEEHNR